MPWVDTHCSCVWYALGDDRLVVIPETPVKKLERLRYVRKKINNNNIILLMMYTSNIKYKLGYVGGATTFKVQKD